MQSTSDAPSPRRLQFGIRTFLISVAVVAVLIAAANAILVPWYLDRYQIAMLKTVNAQVFTEPRGQFLLRQLVGDTFSERSIYLHLDDPQIDDGWVKNIGGMPHIEVLSIKSSALTDTGLMELRSWTKLQNLNLVDTKVTDSGIAALRQSLPSLRLVQSRQTGP